MMEQKEVAIEAAYAKFINDMRVHGREDIAKMARPKAKCWSGAAQLKVILDGVRDSDDVEEALDRAGYSMKFETDELSDAQLLVVLVPFMEYGSGGQFTRSSPSVSKGTSAIRLTLAMVLMLAFAFLMTPPEARAVFLG